MRARVCAPVQARVWLWQPNQAFPGTVLSGNRVFGGPQVSTVERVLVALRVVVALAVAAALTACGGSLGLEGRDQLAADSPDNIFPIDNEAHRAGVQYFRGGEYGLSERSFRKAVNQNPTNTQSWLGLAASYDRLKRFDQADKAYARAVRLDPNSPVVWNNIGFSYLLRGQLKKAGHALQKARQFGGGNRKVASNVRIQSNLALLAAMRQTGGRRGG